MDQNERTIRKLNMIVHRYQQDLANAQLQVADQAADIGMLQQELAEAQEQVRLLQPDPDREEGSSPEQGEEESLPMPEADLPPAEGEPENTPPPRARKRT